MSRWVRYFRPKSKALVHCMVVSAAVLLVFSWSNHQSTLVRIFSDVLLRPLPFSSSGNVEFDFESDIQVENTPAPSISHQRGKEQCEDSACARSPHKEQAALKSGVPQERSQIGSKTSIVAAFESLKSFLVRIFVPERKDSVEVSLETQSQGTLDMPFGLRP